MDAKLANTEENAETTATKKELTLAETLARTAKRILDLLDAIIFLSVLASEFLMMCKWFLNLKLTRVCIDFLLQAVFLCLLTVLFLNICLVASVAGFIRKASHSTSCRFEAMTLLQKHGFDFLHMAISCVSFWVCRTDGELFNHILTSNASNQANYKMMEKNLAADTSAVTEPPFATDVMDKAMSLKQEG